MEDTSKQEILEAIHLLAEQMDERFVRIESDIGILKSDVGTLKSDVSSLKNQMVTKDYLDDKLADLRGDLIALCRKSNTKLEVFVEQMVATGSLKRAAADRILAMEPFAQ